MLKCFFIAVSFFASITVVAQPGTRDELEKQKIQLKKELDQTQRMLDENKSKSKENYMQWKLANDKVAIQDKLIDNISRDINLLDNSLYNTQRDINRYNKLLDTLKQEYAKSMVYAYKNRSNYDYLNFIFSAGSFNDAIKRITYLKSYRDYREMQGQNILRTQDLRKKRLEELTGTKLQKNVALQDKDKELAALEKEKGEKDRIMNELKKQGKQLNDRIASIRKQQSKVAAAITAAIKRALDAERKAAAKRLADEKAKAVALAKAEAAKNKLNAGTKPTTAVPDKPIKTTTSTTKVTPKAEPKPQEFNDATIALSADFVKNRGALPWPVDKGYPLMHYGTNTLPSGTTLVTTGLTIATDIGSAVKAVFDGTVTSIIYVDDMEVVILQHGKYFSTYSNLGSVSVQKGQQVQRGQILGKAAANIDGIGAVDFYISDEKSNQDPERWLRRK
jgi:murein hydrolase activator